MTIVITLIADYFQGHERQKFTGIQVAFMSLGGILLVSLGGFLADISWRTPFLIYVLSLVFLPMAVIYLYEPEVKRIDKQQVKDVKSPPLIWLLIVNTMIMWIVFFILPVHLPFHLKTLGVEKNSLIGIAVAISTLFSAISSFFLFQDQRPAQLLLHILYWLHHHGYGIGAYLLGYQLRHDPGSHDVLRVWHWNDDTQHQSLDHATGTT